MNPVEYLIIGFMVVMAVGSWTLLHAVRNAEDAFENDLGFQLGIAPPVKSLDSLPSFVPTAPPRAVMPDLSAVKPRRPPSSKPPMLPVGMTVADLDARQTGAPWQLPPPAETNPPASTEPQNVTPGSTENPSKP